MKCGVLLAVALLLHASCLAQPEVTSIEFDADWKPDTEDGKRVHERAKKKGAYRLRVRYVKVEGRWTGPVQLPLAVGDVLTPEKLSQAMEALRASITANSNEGFGFHSKGEVGVLFIDVDFDSSQPPSPPDEARPRQNSVGVIFRPFYLHFSLVKIGDNVLPVPRSSRPTFYENVPKPLLALKPTFGVSYDRAFGTALGAAMESDLLHLADPAQSGGSPGINRHLDLHAQGNKSMEELFYRADAGLNYRVRHSIGALREIGIRADYDGAREPFGDGEHIGNAGAARVGVALKLATNTRLWLDTGYRRTDDELNFASPSRNTQTKADENPNRLLFEMIPPGIHGFVRASLWEDNGWQTGSAGSYQRFVGRFGYAKEIRVTENQAIGLEVAAGGGKLWGDAPSSALFFAGNSPGQFLYDAPASPSLLNMPAGPLLRSFGQAEAGFGRSGAVVGGDAFWHVNVNLALPIPLRGWSRPLIPNELTDLEDKEGNPLTIKQVLNNQVNRTGPNMLAAALRSENPRLSQDEATAQAKRILGEVRPATDFIINDANLYSIKPLLMFDAAGLSGGPGRSSEHWLAGGGGMQLTIVTAKLEIGYMHTFSGPTFGDRGNIFARLVFQNLF